MTQLSPPSATPAVDAPGACCHCKGQSGPADAIGVADAATATAAADSVSWVYAVGRIEARFPSLATEKEYAQACGRTDTAGKTDHQALHAVLSQRQNSYLARKLCWVLMIQGLETYLLVPAMPSDLDLLVQSLEAGPGADQVDVVIGRRGPYAPPAMCNGLMVPIVGVDQLYSFSRDLFIKSIPAPDKTPGEQFRPAAEEMFERILQMTDNAGATDEHRALNYLAMRYPAIYARAAAGFASDFSLSGVEVRPSALGGARRILDVIFSYTQRTTDFTEKVFARVDATEEFPFLVSKLTPYYDH